jgi:hypothetical protein
VLARVDPLAERRARPLKLSEVLEAALRLCSVGTRSAVAILTVASEPPLDSGSAGTHVATVSP